MMRFLFRNISITFLGKLILLSTLISITFVYTFPWVLTNSIEKDYSGVDLHGYWYAGHYIRQGVNSFAAILNNPDPVFWNPQIPGSGSPYQLSEPEYSLNLPISYLDGVTVTEFPVAQTLIVVPAITTPLNLLIGLLSWFSWPMARLIWLILNLIFALAIPWLVIRLVDNYRTLNLVDMLIFALLFYNFYGLRQSLVVGQQTLISLILLILALLYKDKWMVSGILLGFGISKYSVGLPIFIYFFLQRKYRAVLIALAVQFMAIFLLLPYKWGTPIDTITAYIKALTVNYAQEGIHLLARFQDYRIQRILFLVILLTVIFLVIRRYVYLKTLNGKENIVELNEINTITLGVFLITYHRVHDMPFMIFFLLLVLAVIIEHHTFAFDAVQSVVITLTTIVIVLLLIFPTAPGKIVLLAKEGNGLFETWLSVDALSSLSMVMMFILSVWLSFRSTLPAGLENTGEIQKQLVMHKT